MCNRYVSPSQAEIERFWHIGRHNPPQWAGGGVYPRTPGPFIRACKDNEDNAPELVIGQWALVPYFEKSAKLSYATNNARSEELTHKASYRQPWMRGQRCIIPAWSFDEPCWESGKNVWWTFTRNDGTPWGLAGLWNTWVDQSSGEVVQSYTMLTVNADAHPVMSRMHKPDLKRGPNEQDKRSVIAIEMSDVEQWLFGSRDDAQALIRPPSMEHLQSHHTT